MGQSELMGIDELLQQYANGERHFVRLTLKKAHLSLLELNEICLKECDLRYSVMHGIDLVNAVVSQSNLSGCKAIGADLTRINLSQSNLQQMLLSRSNLTGANLSHTNLQGAVLNGCILVGANLRYANCANIVLKDADLSGVDLWGAQLDLEDLSNAKLLETILPDGTIAES